ncbi:MAG: T9SS type A sorting domain-containing protein [Chitinophagales bacterium]
MKKNLLIFSLITFIAMQNSYSQTLYEYTFDHYGISNYTNPNIMSTKLRRGNGAKGAGDSCPLGFNTKKFDTSEIYDPTTTSIILELIPNPGVTMTLSSMTSDLRITAKGPLYVRYAYSLDSGITWTALGYDFTPLIAECGGSFTTSPWDMPDFSTDQQLFIRITGYGSIDSTGRLNVSNLIINGTLEMIDEDGDGYGTYIDCDDSNPDIHPGAFEICNDIDEDCDGVASELSSTIWPYGTINLCKHEFITLHANSGYSDYKWLKNGYMIPGQTDSTIYTDKPGYYQVIISDGDCIDTSEVQAITTIENPYANIYYPEGLDLCLDDSLKLKASYGDDYFWQWYKDGEALIFENNYKMPAVEAGNYYCEVSNIYGCTRYTDTVEVINSCRMPGDNSNLTLESFSIYPNPAHDMIVINSQFSDTLSGSVMMKIYDINGKELRVLNLSIEHGAFTQTLNISEFVNGIYIITVFNNTESHSVKFSVSR